MRLKTIKRKMAGAIAKGAGHVDDFARQGRTVDWALWTGLAVLVCGLAGCEQKRQLPPPLRTETSPTGTGKEASAPRPDLPQDRPSGYVGSSACVQCHAAICEMYSSHPMGQSALPMDSAEPLELASEDWLDIPGPQKYRVDHKDGRMVHAQCRYDESGKLLYEQREPIAFCVGSGQSGRAYLVQKGAALYQSPIGWYTGSGSWDLSPGYNSDSHRGFSRRIDDSCLYCHAGRVNSEAETRYGDPVFFESTIGCERCHGPADQHVQFHLAKKPEQTIDPIVNPAKLDTAAREDVCNQCHLQSDYVIKRYGRGFNDFRPGDRLEDVFVILSKQQRGRTRAVSHVEQMRESACYVQSSGAMGCTSCHDPHRRPTPAEQVAFYRDACLKCHPSNACTLEESAREAEPFNNSCYVCHMPSVGTSNVPHTAQTDHWIVKSVEDRERKLSERQTPTEDKAKPALVAFDGAEQRLPKWEVDRARGIALMSTAWNSNDRQMALQARKYLLGDKSANESNFTAAISSLLPDVPVLAEVGASYWLTGPKPLAKPYWEKVLQLEPKNETALGGLALLEAHQENWESADHYLQRLLEVSPHDAQWRVQRAKVLYQLKRNAEAKAEGQKALEIDPTLHELRSWISRL